MDSIRKEIEAEIKRARLDKGRLYDLLLKIVDSGVGGGGGAGAQGPVGPKGAQGPAGPQGPVGAPGASGVCKCISTKDEKPKAAPKEDSKPAAKPAAKKVTVPKKKDHFCLTPTLLPPQL